MKNWLFLLFSLVLVFGSVDDARSEWQLYDNFSSGSIDSSKWSIDDSSAAISIESGAVKFVHAENNPSDSSWLEFKNPGMIKGIKVTVTVEACSGDARARIGGVFAKESENVIWSALSIRADRDYLSSDVAVLAPPNYDYLGNKFWGRFKGDQTIVGETFTMSIIFSKEQVAHAVENQGTLRFDFPTILSSPGDESFKGIGTRSNDGSGSCTVYFDDVYVLKENSAQPAVNFLLLN